jgi:hypothetical protein
MRFSLYAFSALCAFLSVGTTIGIHSFIKGPATFEESLVMYKTGYYLFTKWWVIFHCLFVIFSIYGLTHYLNERKNHFANAGFTFYTIFGVLEIIRMLLVIHYLGTLRNSYLSTSDEEVRALIKISIDGFAGIGNALFAAFTIAILLGNLFTGLACLNETKSIRYLGVGLIVWSAVLVVSIMNEYLNSAGINSFMEVFSLSFQPLIRFAMGVVLIRVHSGRSEAYQVAGNR